MVLVKLDQTSGKPGSIPGFLFRAIFPGKEREQEEDGTRAPPKEKGGIP